YFLKRHAPVFFYIILTYCTTFLGRLLSQALMQTSPGHALLWLRIVHIIHPSVKVFLQIMNSALHIRFLNLRTNNTYFDILVCTEFPTSDYTLIWELP
ncbi:hypothetical protein L9F63_005573, partial [Diploptera punctata]